PLRLSWLDGQISCSWRRCGRARAACALPAPTTGALQAYWGTEQRLCELGFHAAYDKAPYDHLAAGDVALLRAQWCRDASDAHVVSLSVPPPPPPPPPPPLLLLLLQSQRCICSG
ncbi:MAG: hypothetical protein ACK4YT_13550, partial [Sphingomonas sp.]